MKTINKKLNGLNADQTERDKLLNITNARYAGGVERFDDLDIKTLQTLLDKRYASWDECQNDSPSISEFHEFMSDHPEVRAHGYVVDKSRDDYRVTIEGLIFRGPVSMATMLDFVRLCRYADEFVCEKNMLYSWWD